MVLKCEHCGELFEDDEATKIAEYVDDSNMVAFYTMVCPFCGSEEIDEYYDSGEEDE